MNRFLAALVAVVLPVAAAPAQDWAKARLEKSPRHGEWVKVRQGNRNVDSFVVFPEVKDKATAVVVIHEIFGLTDWVRRQRRRPAGRGRLHRHHTGFALRHGVERGRDQRLF